MDNVFFSVIVPVYNVESYIKECVDSILAQDFEKYEIILVDDGSTDNSAVICDEYAQKYQRVKVIHQKNGGLSETRNSGIKAAQGQYILFVDGDDYISAGSFEKIYDVIKVQENIDVVFLEMVKFYPDGSVEPMADGYQYDRIVGKSRDDVLQFITTMPKFPGSACSKAVRRSLIDESLLFTSGLISEDIDWCYRLFGRAEKYSYLDHPYYYYRQNRVGSITNKVSQKNIESILWIVEKWAKKEPHDILQQSINSFVSYQYMILLYVLSKADKKLKNQYFKRTKKMKWILKFGKSRKMKLVCLVADCLGIRITSRLLKIYRSK